MNEWTGKVIIATIIAWVLIALFSVASEVGIERTKTCRAHPQLCDTETGPRMEEEK
jgi:hypothetical protein